MNLGPALQRVFASAPTGIILYECLTFSHPEFRNGPSVATRYDFTTHDERLKLKDERGHYRWFEPAAFQIVLPRRDGELRMEMQMQLDVVDLAVIEELDRAIGRNPEPVAVTYRIHQSDRPDRTPGLTISLMLHDVTTDGQVMQGRLTRANLVDRRFPRGVFMVERFPGLERT